MFDLELERVANWVRDGGYTSVAVQLPEGLKIRAQEISDFITRETGARTLIIGRPCYGACDLFDYRGWCDALVHYGHSAIPSMGYDPDVLYIEARSDASLHDDLPDILNDLPDRIGILATIQYIGLIPDVVSILDSIGKKGIVGTGDDRLAYPGQVLGCNCTAAEAVSDGCDCYLYLGEGDFHPIAAALGTDKTVYVLNPVTGELHDMNAQRDRIIRRRFGAIQTASSAQRFLVILCSKIGQCRSGLASEAERMIRESGRECITAVMEEVVPDSLASYQVDAYVCTACPRVAIDESARYGKPMLTVPELEIALGRKQWNGYPFDQIRADRSRVAEG